MTFDEYQQKAHTTSFNTAIGGDTLLYPVLGLVGEAGEVAEKIKKLYRDKGGKIDSESMNLIAKELGDVCWYVSEICTQMDISLNAVVELNLEKLYNRSIRDALHGSGDNR
jgi:NTP pyrophosphatase (non-canonical NTP hydrolase)